MEKEKAKKTVEEDVLEIPFDNTARKNLFDLGLSKEEIEKDLELMSSKLGEVMENQDQKEATPDDSLGLSDITKKKIAYLEAELERQKKLLEFEKSKNSSEEIKRVVENHIKLTEKTLANLKNTEKVTTAPAEPEVATPETLIPAPATTPEPTPTSETVPITTTETAPPETTPAPTLDVEKTLDNARAKYAEEYKKFLASTGGITRAKRFVFGADIKKIPIELKVLEQEYEKATVELGQKMYKEEEDRLSKDVSLSDNEKKSKLNGFKQNKIFTKVIIDEQTKLGALKAENLPPKEKNLAKKLLDWYMVQERPTKIAISFALSAGFAFTVLPSSVAAAGGSLAYLGVKTARTFVGLGAGQGTAKLYDLIFKDKSAEKRKEAQEKLAVFFGENAFTKNTSDLNMQNMVSGGRKSYAKILEKEQKNKRSRLIGKAMASMVVGGAASLGTGYGMGQILHPSTGNLDTPGTKSGHLKTEVDAKTLGDAKTVTTTTPPVETIKPEDIAIIQKGEGIEHALRRQIEADAILAKNLGFKGDVSDTKALHQFSGGAAHKVAMEHGYVNKITGEEIRVKTAGEVAYRLKLENNGELKIDEMKAEGSLIEGHAKGSEFEKDTEEYEYKGRAIHKPTTEDLGTPKSSESFHLVNERPSELNKFGDLDLIGKHAESDYQESAEVIAARAKVFAGMEGTDKHFLEGTGHKHTAESVLSETMTSTKGTGLMQEYRDIIKNHPEFAKYSKDFTPVKLVEFYETHKGNTNFIFRDDAVDSWEKLKGLKVMSLLDQNRSGDPATRHLAKYIGLIWRHTGLKPMSGWDVFGRGKTAEEYIVNGLKILKEEGRLEQFEANLKK